MIGDGDNDDGVRMLWEEEGWMWSVSLRENWQCGIFDKYANKRY